MSILPMAFNPNGVPKHITIGLLLEELTECSNENSIAKHVHQTASELAALHIDSEGRSTIKIENNPPQPSTPPPPEQQLQQARLAKIKKDEMEAALKVATTYLDNKTLLEELRTSPDLPNNIHGLLEIAIRTHREPLNTVAECLSWINRAETPNSLLARILQVIQHSPINFPTEATQIMLAKEAIKDKMEYLSAQSAFDNAYPDLRAQNFSGERGWYTWMKARIEIINAEAARVHSTAMQINHLQQAQVEELNTHLDHIGQRLVDLETDINHVPVGKQEEDKKKKNKKKKFDKEKYKYYCFLHGHTTNSNHTSEKCTKLIVDENFRFGKNQGKRVTAAMKGATEPGTIDGAEGCTDYFITYNPNSNRK
jgi:hypothetical protein